VRAAFLSEFHPEDPAAAVRVGERPLPETPDGWAIVNVRAASLNHHDVFTARGGVIPPDRLPMIIGQDAAGVDQDGNDVVVHCLVNSPGWVGDEILDPGLTGLGERYQGTFAEQVAIPRRNLVRKPAELSFEEASCLPTSWLTAYRMLFVEADLRPGDRVLVQGAAGGVASACTALGSAAGLRMWVTGRSAEKRAYAESLGAELTFEPGARLPDRVEAVMETVGEPTFTHSMACVRKGGKIVVGGGTGGYVAPLRIDQVFVRNIRIAGSSMGTLEELERLLAFLVRTGVRPHIDSVLSLEETPEAVARMARGDVRGKIVIRPAG
jgi:NADPH:quinone reductase-like Zn-dependent oxidoreductase